MNQASSAVINILINTSTAQAGVSQHKRIMDTIADQHREAARNSALSWNNIFGANFFADLAAGMVRAFAAGFETVAKDAVNAAIKMENAFTGLGTTAKNLGFSETDVVQTVRNLELVKTGLLNVNDAATATKNLLATGFNVGQATELIKRFGDTAAFGRQAALSFGYAISSATEGIKNQNSILVDNAGVTKNISVILREQGFIIQDLSDKVKGQAARQALYNGLLKETALQAGDTNKLLQSTQGAFLQVEAAQFRASAALGEFITKSSTARAVIGVFVTLLNVMANSPGAVLAVAGAVTVLTVALVAMNSANLAALPVISQVIASVSLLGRVMVGNAALIQGSAATLALATAGWVALAAAVVAIGYALYSYNQSQNEAIKITQESISQQEIQKQGYVTQIQSLNDIVTGNQTLAERYRAVEVATRGVNVTTQERVTLAADEADKIRILTEEYKRLNAEQDIRIETTSRISATNLVDDLAKLDQLNQQQIEAATRASKLREEFNRSVEFAQRTAGPGGASVAPELATQARQADQAYSDLGGQITTTTQAVRDHYQQLEQLARIRGVDIETIVRQKFAFDGNSAAADAAVAALRRMELQMGLVGGATDKTTSNIQAQIDAYNQLGDAAERSQTRRKILDQISTQFSEFGVQPGETPKAAASRFFKDLDPQSKALVETEKRASAARKAITELISPRERTGTRKTPVESMTDSLKKLRFEVESYRDLTSPAFKMRFEREELERTKRDFEAIIDLRRELNQPLNAALPASAEAARTELEFLKRVKSIRDDVLKTYRAQQDAEDNLLTVRLNSTAAVVSAQTRADTMYFENLRKRRDGEQQLSADIATELRRRNELESNLTRERLEAEAEAFRDLLNERNREAFDQLKAVARLQAFSGSTFGGNALVDAGRASSRAVADSSPVLQRLDTSNRLLEEIKNALQGSGRTGGAEASGSYVFSGGGATGSAPSKRAAEVLKNVVNPSRFDGMLKQAASEVGSEQGVDPAVVYTLLKATLYRESSGRAGLTSEAGARGYFQQLPATQRRLGVKDPNDFLDAARGSARYLLQGFPNVPGGGLLGGGVPEAFATYFAGEGGGNRGEKTRAYVRDQTFVFKTAMARLVKEQASTPRAVSVPAGTPAPSSGPVFDTSTRPRVNELATVAGQFFGLPDASASSLGSLGPDAVAALQKYLETSREFTRNTREQAIATDRLNQAGNVRFTQVRELEVSEARLARLRGGVSIDVTEALNNAEIQDRRNAAGVLTDIIVKEEYLARLRTGDAETTRRLEETRRAARTNELVGLEQELRSLQEQRGRGGRDTELETLRLRRDYLTQIVAVGKEQADLDAQRALFGDAEYQRAVQQTSITKERADLERQLFEIENERATGPINQALRVRLAGENELLQIQRENLKAQEDAARAIVRINDSQNIHYDQVNAKVLQHIAGVKSMTDIYADAKIGIIDAVYGRIDSMLDRIIGKSNAFTDVFKNMISGILRLQANRVFMQLLFPGSGGSAGGGQAPSGGGIFGGGGGFGGFGGTPPFVPSQSQGQSNLLGLPPGISSMLTGINLAQSGASQGTTTGGRFVESSPAAISAALFGGGLATRPRTVTEQASQTDRIAQAISIVTGGQGNGGNTSTRPRIVQIPGKIFGTGGLLGKGGIFGQQGFGFNSGTITGLAGIGSIVGPMIGGVAGAGITGAAAGVGLASSLSSILGISAIGGPVGLAIGAAIGAVLGIGSALFGKDKLRKKEEIQRTQILLDSKGQMQRIIDALRGGRMDSTTALAQAASIRDNYMQQVGQLTDSKTRRIAQQTVRELDGMIEQIRTLGARADYAAAQEDAFVPTFATGGVVGYVSRLAATARRSPDDNVLGLFNRRETVITPENYYALGGNEAMRRAGVRGAGMANAAYNAYTPSYQAPQGGGMPNIEVVAFADEDTADAWINQSRPQTHAKKVKVAIRYGQDDGLTNTIESKMAGEF